MGMSVYTSFRCLSVNHFQPRGAVSQIRRLNTVVPVDESRRLWRRSGNTGILYVGRKALVYAEPSASECRQIQGHYVWNRLSAEVCIGREDLVCRRSRPSAIIDDEVSRSHT